MSKINGVPAVTMAVLLMLLGHSAAFGDQIISIPDPNLAAGIRQMLQLSADQPITDQAMLGLTSLSFFFDGDLYSLEGLQYATNLNAFYLGNQLRLSDLSPIAGLPHLTTLYIIQCGTQDVSVLDTLPQLWQVDLNDDGITTVPSFASAPNISDISLTGNNIQDISPLDSLTNLISLNLRGNPLNENAYQTDMPIIKSHNSPLLTIYADPIPEPSCLSLMSIAEFIILPIQRKKR